MSDWTAGPTNQPASAAVLVTRLGSTQRIFPVGMPVRVGRSPDLELVSLNPLVSRDTHGVIVSDDKGATYIDQSRRGTFHNGKKLRGPLRITESVTLRLGDPATGEELGITPPLSGSELEVNHERRVRRRRIGLVAAAVAVVVGAGAAALLASSAGSPAAPATAGATPSAAVLRNAEQATVRLLQGSASGYSGWGSGTIIAPDGLILTNGHVAEPQAPGEAVAIGLPAAQLEENPPYLTVELTTGPSSPVVARYRARPVAVDGYLDFAVVQIYATSSGQPVRASSLHLPYLPLGRDTTVQLDQPVTVLGFPGVADSDSISVTSGVISTFVPDPLKHVANPRFELETTARLAHGNSGGAAINDSGQLIGVPSLEVTGEGGDLSWRLRSVAQATPLIADARAGRAYHSRLLVARTGAERSAGAGGGATAAAACGRDPGAPHSAQSVVFGDRYSRVPAGLDLALLVELPDGTAVTNETGGLPQLRAARPAGCFTVGVDAAGLDLARLPAGTYRIQLYGGPDLTPIGSATAVSLDAG